MVINTVDKKTQIEVRDKLTSLPFNKCYKYLEDKSISHYSAICKLEPEINKSKKTKKTNNEPIHVYFLMDQPDIERMVLHNIFEFFDDHELQKINEIKIIKTYCTDETLLPSFMKRTKGFYAKESLKSFFESYERAKKRKF